LYIPSVIFPLYLYDLITVMRKLALLFLSAGFAGGSVSAQNGTDSLGQRQTARPPIYRIKPAADIPVEAIGAAWDLYNFSQISKKENSSVAEVQSLKINKIDWFDRWAVHPSTKKCGRISGSSRFYMPRP
jgi:hypothetical protein